MQLTWSEINKVRSDLATADFSIPIYKMFSRNRPKKPRVVIGPWIAHYKDLLRDILIRVPDDAQTDVNVYHAIRRKGETIEESYRTLARERQAWRSTHPLLPVK